MTELELNFPSIKGNAISSAADSLTHTPNSQNGGGIGLPSIKDASRDTGALVVGQVVDQLGHLPLAQGELCFALVVITIRRSKTTREAPAARSGSRADSLTHTQIVIAPTGSNRAFHSDGEVAVANAARTGNHLQILSSGATTSIEDVIAARGAPVWFQ